jgi:hypothetical protein
LGQWIVSLAIVASGKGGSSSKFLRLEVADDGGGDSNGNLDVRLQSQARAVERGFALLENTALGVEVGLLGMLGLGKRVVQCEAVEVSLQPGLVAPRGALVPVKLDGQSVGSVESARR